MEQKSHCSDILKSHPDKGLKNHLKEVLNHTEDLINNISFFKGKDDLIKTTKLIACCHDFGKSSEYFQNYIEGELENSKKLASHGVISALFALYILEGEELKDKDFLKLLAYNTIKHHHGNLDNIEKKIRYKQNRYILDILSSIKKNKKEIEGIYEELLGFSISIDDFENFVKNKIFGSSRNPYFIVSPLFDNKLENEQRYFFIFSIIYSILLESDKKSASGTEELEYVFQPSENYLEKYKERFDYNDDFNQIREKIYRETIDNLEKIWNDKRFFEIDAPTGSGKTLTMLGAALKLREKIRNKKDYEPKIIYSLPFISIIEQNYTVFKDVIESNEGVIDDRILMEYHHLADDVFEVGNSKKKYSKSSFLTNNWYSEIIVTTFYQLFKSIYTNKNHQLQKANKFADSIILIDEIQSVPPSLIIPIRNCLKFIAEELNSYIILGTATQPKLNKERESETKKLKSEKIFSLEQSDISDSTIDDFFNRYKFNLKHFNKKLTISDLEKILRKSKDLNNFMVVLNTISSTKKLFELLRESEELQDFELIYLSTNISPAERSKRIGDAKDKIKDNEKIIIITTQLIEAGVDISVERIYRDKAPLDKMVQTAGRTNRNNEINGLSNVFVLDLVNEDHNNRSYSSYVYNRILLNITKELLKERDSIDEKNLRENLIPEYFSKVIKSIAQGIEKDKSGNERNLIKEINFMEFKKVEEDFKLIENNLPEITCFIMESKDDRDIWRKFVEISKMPSKTLEEYFRKKKRFSDIKREFNKRTITVRVSSEDEKEEIKQHIHRLSTHELEKKCKEIFLIDTDNKELYDDKTGVKVKDIESAMVF